MLISNQMNVFLTRAAIVHEIINEQILMFRFLGKQVFEWNKNKNLNI